MKGTQLAENICGCVTLLTHLVKLSPSTQTLVCIAFQNTRFHQLLRQVNNINNQYRYTYGFPILRSVDCDCVAQRLVLGG